MEGKASDPSAWEFPFSERADRSPELIDLGDAHFVRAHRAPEGSEARHRSAVDAM